LSQADFGTVEQLKRKGTKGSCNHRKTDARGYLVCIDDCEHNEQGLGKEHLNPDIRFKQVSCNSAKNCTKN
jgi:hypothetical protein